MRAAACGTDAGLERWAKALLPTGFTQGTAQVGTLSCLNITFSSGLQLSPFPFAVVGSLARKGERSAKGEMGSRQEPITEVSANKSGVNQ